MENDLTGSYVLAADIDCSDTVNWNGGAGFNPIGWYIDISNKSPFTGRLNGGNYTIFSLSVYRPSMNAVGLFGYVSGVEMQVTDLGLEDVSVEGNFFVGGLVGYQNGGVIRQCYSSGTILGLGKIGGLVGWLNNATITQSHAAGNVSIDSGFQAGGLVGHQQEGSITRSYATGNIAGSFQSDHIGGLVGLEDTSSITQSYAAGSILGSNSVGGLVGLQYISSITQSYAIGDVSLNSGNAVGGLVGYQQSASTITESYAIGRILGSINVGGLVGLSEGASTSSISYWDTQTSGVATSDGGLGKTTSQMYQQSTFVGWNFVDIWQINEGAGYPELQTVLPLPTQNNSLSPSQSVLETESPTLLQTPSVTMSFTSMGASELTPSNTPVHNEPGGATDNTTTIAVSVSIIGTVLGVLGTWTYLAWKAKHKKKQFAFEEEEREHKREMMQREKDAGGVAV